jgi:hypothetical protein
MAGNKLKRFAITSFLLMSSQYYVSVGGFALTSTYNNFDWPSHGSILRSSSNDNNDNPSKTEVNTKLDEDATPIFEDNQVTFFGLEPKAELDPLDNGLVFTGPIILLVSIYLTVSLWFVDDVPLDPF